MRLGRHILAEFYNCDEIMMNDVDFIAKAMTEAARVSGATVVGSDFHEFKPWGVSGVVVISESHLSIHTWPEYKYAAIDLFTCGSDVNPWIGLEFLKERFCAGHTETQELSRGIVEKIKKYSFIDSVEITHKPKDGIAAARG